MILGFVEVPSNETVNLGSVEHVVFRCRHTSSEATISWRVNGLPVGQFPDIRTVSVSENGNIVDTLTIPAELEYNGTVVECLAIFIDGSPTERTPAATIIFTITSPTNAPGIVPSIYK